MQFCFCFYGIWFIQPLPELAPSLITSLLSTMTTFFLLPVAYEVSDNLHFEKRPAERRRQLTILLWTLLGMVLSVLGPIVYFFF